MDPWCTNYGTDKTAVIDNQNEKYLSKSFEDDFQPTVSDTLPDSEDYLKKLERRLHRIRTDSDILERLAEKREACMQQLLNGLSTYDHDDTLDTPLNSSSLLRAVAPEKQALTTGEVVELIKYDSLNPENNTNPDNTTNQ